MGIGIRLPWLGNVESNELGLIAAVLMLCCLIAGLVGHLMGCSDPTAPTQYPFWHISTPKEERDAENPPKKKNDDAKASKEVEKGPIKKEATKMIPSAEKERTPRRVSSGRGGPSGGGFGRSGPPPSNDGPKVKLDSEKQAEEVKIWAEKKKAAQEKAATRISGFGRSPQTTGSGPKRQSAPASSDNDDDGDDLEFAYTEEGSGL